MNPFTDTLGFLMRAAWPIYAFWVLLVGSIVVALFNLASDPAQRTLRHVWMWLMRLFIGGLWWQQTLWKLPPTYTDNPVGVSGGLHYWIGEMVQHAAFEWQRAFVVQVIQQFLSVCATGVCSRGDNCNLLVAGSVHQGWRSVGCIDEYQPVVRIVSCAIRMVLDVFLSDSPADHLRRLRGRSQFGRRCWAQSSWTTCTQSERDPGASPYMAHLEGCIRHDPAKD